jgi:hypothetical protein
VSSGAATRGAKVGGNLVRACPPTRIRCATRRSEDSSYVSRAIWRDLVFRGLAFLSLTILAIWHPWNYSDKIQEPTSQQSPEDSRRESADERIAEYTFVLDVFTALLAISTIGLWVVTWRSGIKQSRDMAKSLAIASRGAAAAMISAETAKRAIESNRAWITWKDHMVPLVSTSQFRGVPIRDSIGLVATWRITGNNLCT